jgi:CRP-like cAMP-binding protein
MAAADRGELRRNAILGRLPAGELNALRDSVEIVDTAVRQSVYEPGGPIDAVYFPLSAVFSLVGVTDGEASIEVATIGYEGMVGLPAFLGAATSPHASFCQIAGSAARMATADLRRALNRDGHLHSLLNRFTQSTMVQIAQNVVCNGTHSLEERMARWLLTTHDRVGHDQFDLTQQFLAQMLGARRPTVSQTASKLQSRGLIRYSRGVMTIVNRQGLERLTCDCYGIVKAEFDAITQGT